MSPKTHPKQPAWIEQPPAQDSFRSIFKWGSPTEFKHPNEHLVALMQKTFGLNENDLLEPRNTGEQIIDFKLPRKLSQNKIKALRNIVGSDNVATDSYTRVKNAYGKTMLDLMRLREGLLENIPDAVLYPKDKEEIQQIVQYCHKHRLPLYPIGGRSSVTRGFEAVKGGIALDLSVHMNQIMEFNETNHTIKVQPGIYGPDLEDALNQAPNRFGSERAYTCGHFPQSFEFSTVGGWIAALGSGQESTYYGDMKDLIIAQEYVTPSGTYTTREFPAAATGPDIGDIFSGSEGTLGILVSATIKVFHYQPQNRRRFSFIFKSYEEGLAATREISQGEFGNPSVFRLSDPEETDVALKLYGIEGTLIDRWIKIRGFKPMQRALLIGAADGDADYSALVKKKVKKICHKHGGMNTTGFVVSQWEKGRYKDPYMREDLQDFGLMIDTLETSVRWDNLKKVHEGVRNYIKSRPNTICMTHSSHFYPQVTNLYFIFIAKMDQIREYKEFQAGIIQAIYENGGSLSHHHGIGRMISPWFESYLGTNEINLLKAIKKHLDPRLIMNPGGTLALDGPLKEKSPKTTKSSQHRQKLKRKS
jgi:alkyldihydroxyacetonephosphate synthase